MNITIGAARNLICFLVSCGRDTLRKILADGGRVLEKRDERHLVRSVCSRIPYDILLDFDFWKLRTVLHARMFTAFVRHRKDPNGWMPHFVAHLATIFPVLIAKALAVRTMNEAKALAQLDNGALGKKVTKRMRDERYFVKKFMRSPEFLDTLRRLCAFDIEAGTS